MTDNFTAIDDLLEKNKCPDIQYLRHEFKRSELDNILSAFRDTDAKTLSPVWNLLIKRKTRTPYLKIRLARLFLE